MKTAVNITGAPAPLCRCAKPDRTSIHYDGRPACGVCLGVIRRPGALDMAAQVADIAMLGFHLIMAQRAVARAAKHTLRAALLAAQVSP